MSNSSKRAGSPERPSSTSRRNQRPAPNSPRSNLLPVASLDIHIWKAENVNRLISFFFEME
jgi:hypothetical protein